MSPVCTAGGGMGCSNTSPPLLPLLLYTTDTLFANSRLRTAGFHTAQDCHRKYSQGSVDSSVKPEILNPKSRQYLALPLLPDAADAVHQRVPQGGRLHHGLRGCWLHGYLQAGAALCCC